MPKNVGIRFECGLEDRMTQEIGPFEYVELTYTELQGLDGEMLAYFDDSRNPKGWRIATLMDEKVKKLFPNYSLIRDHWWSDIAIFSWEEETTEQEAQSQETTAQAAPPSLDLELSVYRHRDGDYFVISGTTKPMTEPFVKAWKHALHERSGMKSCAPRLSLTQTCYIEVAGQEISFWSSCSTIDAAEREYEQIVQTLKELSAEVLKRLHDQNNNTWEGQTTIFV